MDSFGILDIWISFRYVVNMQLFYICLSVLGVFGAASSQIHLQVVNKIFHSMFCNDGTHLQGLCGDQNPQILGGSSTFVWGETTPHPNKTHDTPRTPDYLLVVLSNLVKNTSCWFFFLVCRCCQEDFSVEKVVFKFFGVNLCQHFWKAFSCPLITSCKQ